MRPRSKADNIFREFLYEEAAALQQQAEGPLLTEAELANKLKLSELESVRGLTRARVDALLEKLDRGDTVEEPEITEQPSLYDLIKEYLRAKAGVTDRQTYNQAVFGLNRFNQETIRKKGFKGVPRSRAGYFHREAVLPGQLASFILGKQIPTNNVNTQDYLEIGDILYGPMDMTDVRKKLLSAMWYAGVTDMQTPMTNKQIGTLNAMVRDGKTALSRVIPDMSVLYTMLSGELRRLPIDRKRELLRAFVNSD